MLPSQTVGDSGHSQLIPAQLVEPSDYPKRSSLAEPFSYAALATIAALLVVWSTTYNLGVNPDASGYAIRGMIWAETGELSGTLFAPLLDLQLGILDRLGIEILPTMRVVLVLTAAVNVILAALIARQMFRSTTLRIIAVAVVAFSPALLSISSMMLTDPLVLPWILMVIYASNRMLAAGRFSWLWVTVASVCIWVAFLYRYASLALVPLIALTVILCQRNWPWPSRLVRALAATVLAMAVPVLWMVRNYLTDGTFMGTRGAGNVMQNAPVNYFKTLGGWLLPFSRDTNLLVWTGIAIAAIALIGLALAVRKHWLGHPVPLAAQLYFLIYSLFIIYSASNTIIDHLGNRLLEPIFVATLFSVLYALSEMSKHVPVSRPARWVGIGVTAAIIGQLAIASIVFADHSAEHGYRETAPRYNDSVTSVALREIPHGACVYSNVMAAVVFNTGHSSLTAARKFGQSSTIDISKRDLKYLKERVEQRDCYLAWYENSGRWRMVPPDGHRSVVDVIPLAESDNGDGLYLLKSRKR